MTRYTRLGALGAAAVLAATLTGLAGCHGRSPDAGAASSIGPGEDQVTAVLEEYTRCMRDHGVPSFQQPRLVDGRIRGGGASAGVDNEAMKAAANACQSIAARLPNSLWGREEPTAAELDTLRQWAACLRQHGLPDWPDPDSRGRFAVIGTPMENDLKGDGAREAVTACRQYGDGGSVRLTTP